MSKYKKECYILIGIVVVLSFVSYCIFNSSIKEKFNTPTRPPRIYKKDHEVLTGHYTHSNSFIHNNKVRDTIFFYLGKPDIIQLTTSDQTYMILPDKTRVNLISHGYNIYISKYVLNKPTYYLKVLNDDSLHNKLLPKILFLKTFKGITTNIGTRYKYNFNIYAKKILYIDHPTELDKFRIKNGFSQVDLNKNETLEKSRPNFKYFIDTIKKWPFELENLKAINKTSDQSYIDFIKKNNLDTIKISVQRVFKSPISLEVSKTNISDEVDLQILKNNNAYQQIIIPGVKPEKAKLKNIDPVFSHTLVYFWKYHSANISEYKYINNTYLEGITQNSVPFKTKTKYFIPVPVTNSDGKPIAITNEDDFTLDIRSLLGSDKIPNLEVSGSYKGNKKDWTTAYPNIPLNIWRSDKLSIPIPAEGNRVKGTVWCEINNDGNKVRAISCALRNRSDYNCPKGFTKNTENPEWGSNICLKFWKSDCGSECAEELCTSNNGKWIPESVRSWSTNPYTCQMPNIQVSSPTDCYNPNIQEDTSSSSYTQDPIHGFGNWVGEGDISSATYNNQGPVTCEMRKTGDV